jgi:hypothetical protein
VAAMLVFFAELRIKAHDGLRRFALTRISHGGIEKRLSLQA